MKEAEADYRNRVRRPRLFPGAAYEVASGMTGLRGTVTRNGKPARWTRIVARLPGANGTVVGRAHGDDRGEFLLLIAPTASAVGVLVDPLSIRVDGFGPEFPPVPIPATLPKSDRYWDLPVEAAPKVDLLNPNRDDPVSTGEEPPADYTATTGRLIQFTLG